MTLMEFSIMPLDKGSSMGTYVAGVLSVVDESGLDYRLNPMGTVVEGEWDELLEPLTRCFRVLEKASDRISIQVKFDYRKGVSGALESKIRSVEAKAGRSFKTFSKSNHQKTIMDGMIDGDLGNISCYDRL